jgi:hypothetical protein
MGAWKEFLTVDKWLAARREALFKKTDDGYVFKFGRRYFLVDDSQKAEIQQLKSPPWSAGALVAPFVVVQMFTHGRPDDPLKIDTALWIIVLVILSALLGPYSRRLFYKQQIDQILVGGSTTRSWAPPLLPRHTEQRITWCDRNDTMATMVTKTSLALRGIASLVCAWLSISFLVYTVRQLTSPWFYIPFIIMWTGHLIGSGVLAFQIVNISFLKISRYRQGLFNEKQLGAQ